ncbi:MAG: RNA polymerase sigma factor [Pirellulaceae bacterium]|nr:MAG: RNA polymerase sigma factor [Pirellulaceae bacterium]
MDPSKRLERISQWVAEHGPAVRAYAWALLRNAHDADDVVQEVFRRCWEQSDRYLEMGRPRAYLIRIADRLVMDQLRREKHLRADDQAIAHHRASDPDPAQSCAEQEALAAVEQALDKLRPLQRRVLLLRYFGQMSFAEIAEQMNLPLNTVLSHCHRGLKNLRKLLAEFAP